MNEPKESLFSKFEQRKKQVETEELNIQYEKLDKQESHSKSAINELTDADMPAIEDLNENSDYSMFMSNKVSDILRKKALRKLFLSSDINVLDSLNDYDEDYTFFKPLGDIIPYDLKQKIKREAEKNKDEIIKVQDDSITKQANDNDAEQANDNDAEQESDNDIRQEQTKITTNDKNE